MAWFANVRADLARACANEEGGTLRRLALALAAPGTQAVLVYRFGHWALGAPRPLNWALGFVYHALHLAVRVLWGIELPRRTRIGPGLYIGHFGGVTVSQRALIGANCALSQGVTIGIGGRGEAIAAPVIGDDVYIATGACVYGGIRIGNNVKIGPNACVHADVPDDAIVALEPGFVILSYRGNRRQPASAASGLRRFDRRRSASTG